MKRNRVRLTESQLHRVIKNSVKKVLKEEYDCYEHEEMTDEINGQFDNLVASIRKNQQYYLENCERNNTMNKFSSGVKALKDTFQNGGGMRGFQQSYNNNRATFMDDQQTQANAQLQQQINNIDRQIKSLAAQKQRLVAQKGRPGAYAKQAETYRTKAKDARQKYMNYWGIPQSSVQTTQGDNVPPIPQQGSTVQTNAQGQTMTRSAYPNYAVSQNNAIEPSSYSYFGQTANPSSYQYAQTTTSQGVPAFQGSTVASNPQQSNTAQTNPQVQNNQVQRRPNRGSGTSQQLQTLRNRKKRNNRKTRR